jgi:hypothetical protein
MERSSNHEKESKKRGKLGCTWPRTVRLEGGSEANECQDASAHDRDKVVVGG